MLLSTPSTDVGSMPSLIIISAIGPPALIDWPTMVCCQVATRPCASSPALTAWTYIGRYSPALVSSSRVNCSRTGARPPIALATLTAATVKSLQPLARRPKLPPDTSVCSLTLSIGSPAAFAANMWSKVGNWCPDHVSSMPSCSQATQFIGSIDAWARNGNSYTASIVFIAAGAADDVVGLVNGVPG